MSEVITLLSSDEEESPPPRKRIKPVLLDEVTVAAVKTNKLKENSEDIVILSDEDDCVREKTIIHLSQQINNKNINHSETVKDDDNDSVTFIDEKDDTDDNSKHVKSNANLQNGSRNHTENKVKNGINSDENNSEESSGKENKCISNKTSPQINNRNEPSTSKISADTVLDNFLSICEESINNSQYEHLKDKQFPLIRKYYKKIGSKLSESLNFVKLIEENVGRAKKSPAAAVISFNEVFQYIKELVDSESIEVSEEHRIKLKKLEKTIRLLIAKIKYLENADINFDDEEDSTYLQLDRYTNRLNKVYEKYCQLLKKNPHSGRITYEKLDFVDSEYNEINKAINKKYKNNKKFPSYLEMEKFIKHIVTQHNLSLSEIKIKSESVRCFKKLGELLQSRRKKELYDSHYVYIRDNEDPATKDSTLNATLKQNFAESQIKIEKICEEFVMKEEHGEEVELSEEDSDKSNYVDSDNDDNED